MPTSPILSRSALKRSEPKPALIDQHEDDGVRSWRTTSCPARFLGLPPEAGRRLELRPTAVPLHLTASQRTRYARRDVLASSATSEIE